MEELLKKIKSALRNNEADTVTLRGVTLSVSDLEVLKLYAETYLKQGHFGDLEPVGNIKKVLDEYGAITNPYSFWA